LPDCLAQMFILFPPLPNPSRSFSSLDHLDHTNTFLPSLLLFGRNGCSQSAPGYFWFFNSLLLPPTRLPPSARSYLPERSRLGTSKFMHSPLPRPTLFFPDPFRRRLLWTTPRCCRANKTFFHKRNAFASPLFYVVQAGLCLFLSPHAPTGRASLEIRPLTLALLFPSMVPSVYLLANFRPTWIWSLTPSLSALLSFLCFVFPFHMASN